METTQQQITALQAAPPQSPNVPDQSAAKSDARRHLFFDEVAHVCREASRGNLEVRIQGFDSLTDGDEELAAVHHGINSLLDYTESFIREAKAALGYAADGKYFRRVLLGGMNGTFRHAAELINTASEQMKEKSDAIERAKSDRLSMADSFEETVKGITDSLLDATHELHAVSTELSSTAKQTSSRSKNALETANYSVKNVREVSDSAEQMQSSITEIDGKMEETASRVERVVVEVTNAMEVMKALGQSSASIDNVVETIEEVARQTHLLSFNAAIEAARSGSAGAGFAVVAAEVRNLAERTKTATQQVKEEISRVQSNADNAVQSIGRFGEAIEQLSKTSEAVSHLIRDQKVATDEIQNNVTEAMKCTESVKENISGVSGAATQTDAATDKLREASEDLERQGTALSQGVEMLLAKIRADGP
ncbi:methyl-accepting chemotaxis protein [Roseiconus lacunae]|uniref:Methyl-accepting chemotaxis protein n=1 Tax=Roseiconus lacunae TaxID=2605694 RepID=A0ABT7PQK9_9BACT|nr:methyl-accepting chemotaxis protein [Roseiconus lacunae]MDM4018790.1 methyl-accepting chemotaxis protein [Roseiconus lacunae]